MKSDILDASMLKKNSEFVELFIAKSRREPSKSNLGLMFPRQTTLDFLSDMAVGLFDKNPTYYLDYPLGSPLRNPLLGGKRIGMSYWPTQIPTYWPVLAAYTDHMRRRTEAQYVASAFPKKFNAQRHQLPCKLYTADVAYFVLTGNIHEDIKSMSQIRANAVKAWEC